MGQIVRSRVKNQERWERREGGGGGVGRDGHSECRQGNIIAQRALSAALETNGVSTAGAENRERTTFCFPLLGSDRMAVVDVCTASVVIHVLIRCINKFTQPCLVHHVLHPYC